MISFEEALEKVLRFTSPLKTKKVSLLDCRNKVLAENVIAKENLPPFDRSPLDGYALKAESTTGASRDNPNTVKVIDSVPAGFLSDALISSGQAIRIMTGAPIPAGADCVIRQENTDKVEVDKIIIYEELKPRDNIIKAGEDVSKGEVVLKVGDILTPADIGLLAALGHDKVKVFPSPKVGILATGSELIDISETLTKGKIRNSNSYMLAALVNEYGGEPIIAGITKDNIEEICQSIENMLCETDILMTTGGVSVGDYDLLPDVLEKVGANRLFWKVAMKPGTPLLVAEKNSKLIFSFSGNPAACLITFEQFAGPYLLKMQGRKDYTPKWGRAILKEDLGVKKSSQLRFVRGCYRHNEKGEIEVNATGSQKPGVLSSFRNYNCYIVVSGKTSPRRGDEVRIQFKYKVSC